MELHTDRSMFVPHSPEGGASMWFKNAERPLLSLKIFNMLERFRRTRSDDRYTQDMAELRTLAWFLKSENVLKDAHVHTSRYNDTPMFCACYVSPYYPKDATDGYTRTTSLGNGFGEHVSEALSQAFGEYLERYFLSLYRKRDLKLATPEELAAARKHFVHPSCFAGTSREQRAALGSGHVETTRFAWTRATHLQSGNKIFLPAQHVYWTYMRERNEPPLKDITTNGAAGWFTKDGAVLRGLCELVQRDAFMIFWMNKLTPPKIDPASIPNEAFQELYEKTRRYQFDVHCLDFTADTKVPTFGVVLVDQHDHYPHQTLGLSTNPDPIRALQNAFEESWSIYYWMRKTEPVIIPETYIPFSDATINPQKRAALFATKQNKHHYTFLLEGKPKCFDAKKWVAYPQEEKEQLAAIIDHVASLSPRDNKNDEAYQTYVYLADAPILKNIGYYAAQVIVPALIPLHINEHMASCLGERFALVPERLGYAAAKALNTSPQPFP